MSHFGPIKWLIIKYSGAICIFTAGQLRRGRERVVTKMTCPCKAETTVKAAGGGKRHREGKQPAT